MSETDPHALFEEFEPVTPEEWRSKVRKEIGTDAVEEFLEWSSQEGVTIPAYLHRSDLEDCRHVDLEATMPPVAEGADVPANGWTPCQPLNHPDPDTANEYARSVVEEGVCDLQLSLPPPSSRRFGPALRSTDDLTTVLKDIDLNETGLHLDDGLAAVVLYGALRTHLSRQSVDPKTVSGSIGFDPVASLASGEGPDGDRLFALAHQLVGDAKEIPSLRSWTVDARVYHDAGASAVQELAYTLGALTERLARHTKRGLELGRMGDKLHVIVPVSTSYFVEIAKLRALRLLVPQVINPFLSNGRTPSSFSPSDLHLRAETSRRVETLYDPHANMLRGTTEAMAAILGGCDVLSIHPYDHALRPSESFGHRIARNTQLILRHEAHFDQVADPAAGSYYLESLTDKLARQAWNLFQKVEANGGIVECLSAGAVQRTIKETRQERRDAVNEREQVLVGTTHYPALNEQRWGDHASPPDDFTAEDGDPVSLPDSPSIQEIRNVLQDGGSPSAVLKKLRGDQTHVDPLPRLRLAAEIESLRLRTEAYAETRDGPPRVLPAPVGPPAARSARATFARNFLGVAGFEIKSPLKFESVDEIASEAAEQNADVVVLCSSDAAYADLAPSLASALTNRVPEALLVIAGSPDKIDGGDAADFFLHEGSPLQETLQTLQSRLGIPVE